MCLVHRSPRGHWRLQVHVRRRQTLTALLAELPAASPLARGTDTLAKFVRKTQRTLSQQHPADSSDELLDLATSLKEKLEGQTLVASRAHTGNGDALVSAALVFDIYSSNLLSRGADHRGNQVDAAFAQLL